MPVNQDDLKFILSLDIDEAQKELDILEKQAGHAFDPMLQAGRKLAAEMKGMRDAARAHEVEILAKKHSEVPELPFYAAGIAKDRFEAQKKSKEENRQIEEEMKKLQWEAMSRGERGAYYANKGLGGAGNVAGSLASMMGGHGMDAGGVGNLVGAGAGTLGAGAAAGPLGGAAAGVAKIIEAPFAMMAKSAQNTARALMELEGPLGVVGDWA